MQKQELKRLKRVWRILSEPGLDELKDLQDRNNQALKPEINS